MQLLAWLDALGAATFSASTAASRRTALARLGRGALAVAPAALTAPVALAGPPKARVTSATTGAFNQVLRVARAQYTLVSAALAAGTVPAAAVARLQTVRDFTQSIITRLETTIELSGDTLTPTRTYDFSSDGALDPATYPTVLLLAQVFADVMSRALLSALDPIAGTAVFAELAGQLLGTSSRLAALVRLERQTLVPTLQPWVVKADAEVLPAFFTVTTMPYAGEDSDLIYGVLDLSKTDTTAVLDPLPAAEVRTAAFDQPLPRGTTETFPDAAIEQLLGRFER